MGTFFMSDEVNMPWIWSLVVSYIEAATDTEFLLWEPATVKVD